MPKGPSIKRSVEGSGIGVSLTSISPVTASPSPVPTSDTTRKRELPILTCGMKLAVKEPPSPNDIEPVEKKIASIVFNVANASLTVPFAFEPFKAPEVFDGGADPARIAPALKMYQDA